MVSPVAPGGGPTAPSQLYFNPVSPNGDNPLSLAQNGSPFGAGMQGVVPDLEKMFASFDMAKMGSDTEMTGQLGTLGSDRRTDFVGMALAQTETDRALTADLHQQGLIAQEREQRERDEAMHDMKVMQDPIRHGEGGEALAGLGKKALTNPIGAAVDVVTNPIGVIEDVGQAIGDVFTGGKIVCTAMNQAYGFGSFRQKIWLEYGRGMAPEYQAGYHLLFKPLVRYAYGGAGTLRIGLRQVLEYIARHRTADLWALRRGRRHWTGACLRAVLEPACYLAGWFALRRRR